jgi:hypothetical protein
MKRGFALIAVTTGCLLLPVSAEARSYVVPCRTPEGDVIFKVKPRTCTVGGRFGYQQVDLVRIRWTSWGRTARGSGISFANMGGRARTRFRVYRPRLCEGEGYAYTRARGIYANGFRWRLPFPLGC